MTPGLKLTTILYAGGLAVVSAAMLSFLPALKVTRARVQPHLANLGTGGATLRFGRVWTGAMIVQVALTAIGIPVAMETASQAMRKLNIRAAFPSREYLAARIDLDRPFEEEATSAFEARRARTFAELERRIAQEPGVVAVTFADRAPGSGGEITIGRGRVLSRRRAGVRRCDFGRRRWARDSSRPSIVRSSPGVRSTRATGVPVPERSSSTRRSRASFRAMREADRRSALASGIRARHPRRAPTRQRRTRGSRSSASCATSAWTLTTRATNSRLCFTRRRRERCLRS